MSTRSPWSRMLDLAVTMTSSRTHVKSARDRRISGSADPPPRYRTGVAGAGPAGMSSS